MSKHKHHDVIVAWANGAEIEFYNNSHGWIPCPNPCWNVDNESQYRIKPNKHQHLIDAYKEGKTIQMKSRTGKWYDIAHTSFNNMCIENLFLDDIEYRVKHKNQDVIDAYLRGETVQYYNSRWYGGWLNVMSGCNLSVFDTYQEFRIKPEPKPDIRARLWGDQGIYLTFVFDGETKAFKTVEYHDD